MSQVSDSRPVALLSVFNKTNLDAFATQLVQRFNYRLLATGGTRRFLRSAGLEVEDLTEITGFEDLLEGRVKSLHPDVFAGILAKRDKPEHLAQVKLAIDLVCVNLYPFEDGLRQAEVEPKTDAEMVELVDIGGSALIRAAAKNYESVSVVCDPEQYEAIVTEMVTQGGTPRPNFRRALAAQAFERSVQYDSAILSWLRGEASTSALALEETITLKLNKLQPMRYGENPHQPAALYSSNGGQLNFDLLNGKPLSYNNMLDMEAAWSLICEFEDHPTATIIKHTIPCGVASGPSISKAYKRAFDCDPLSAFGGIVAFNQEVDEETAKQLKEVFLEVIIAPSFTEEALGLLRAKKNLRLVQRPFVTEPHPAVTNDGLRVRQVSKTLFLAQVNDYLETEKRLEQDLTVVTEKKPSSDQLQDLAFAWRVAKHVKSNAIVIVKDGKTLGICGGQTSRVGAVEKAIEQACGEAQDAVLASDGFFPAIDNIQVAAQNRIAAIIQPGGSIKDKDVIASCNQFELAMVTTGVREFRH